MLFLNSLVQNRKICEETDPSVAQHLGHLRFINGEGESSFKNGLLSLSTFSWLSQLANSEAMDQLVDNNLGLPSAPQTRRQ